MVFFAVVMAFLTFVHYNSLSIFSEASNGGSCRACPLLNLGQCCEVTCSGEQCCYCSAGLFSSTCTTYKCGTQPPRIIRTIPDITPKQEQDANDFADWCQNQTPGIQALAPIVHNILQAIDGNDQNAYSAYEQQFRDSFVSLSQSEQDSCNQWAISRGY